MMAAINECARWPWWVMDMRKRVIGLAIVLIAFLPLGLYDREDKRSNTLHLQKMLVVLLLEKVGLFNGGFIACDILRYHRPCQ